MRTWLGSEFTRTWLASGFTRTDLADGGSDRCVDSLVVRGSADVVARHALTHLEAGADHIALQIVTDDPHTFPFTAWRAVAERLTRLAQHCNRTWGLGLPPGH